MRYYRKSLRRVRSMSCVNIVLMYIDYWTVVNKLDTFSEKNNPMVVTLVITLKKVMCATPPSIGFFIE